MNKDLNSKNVFRMPGTDNIPIIKARPELEVIKDINYNCGACKKNMPGFLMEGSRIVPIPPGTDLSQADISRVDSLVVFMIAICNNCGNIYCARKVIRKIKGKNDGK